MTPRRTSRKLFGRTSDSISTLALVVGLITAVVFTTSVAAVQQRGFELIWTLPRLTGVRSYLRQLVWAPALTVFIVALLVAGRIGSVAEPPCRRHRVLGGGRCCRACVTFLFYWWTQYWLLRGRVEWRALLPGALAVGVVTTVVVRVSRLIMRGQISWQVHAYGLVGAVFVLSVWLMVLSAVIFGGILIGAMLGRAPPRPPARPPASGRDEIERSPLTEAGLDSSRRPEAERARGRARRTPAGRRRRRAEPARRQEFCSM